MENKKLYVKFQGKDYSVKTIDTGRNKYFACDIKDVFGKRKRIYSATMGELKEKLDKIAIEKERALTMQKPTDKNFFEYIKFYLKNAGGSQLHGKVIIRMLNISENVIKNSIIDKPIKKITDEDLYVFFTETVSKCVKGTADVVVELLQKTYELAVKLGDIDESFMSNLEFNGKSDRTSFKIILSPQKFERLLNAVINNKSAKRNINECLIAFSMLTGFPYSSFENLKTKDVLLEDKKFILRGKTIDMTERTYKWLKLKKEKGFLLSGNEDELVFLNSRNCFPNANQIASSLKFFYGKYGADKGLTPTALYKSYVVNELSKGKTSKELAKYFETTVDAIEEIAEEYKVLDFLY